MELLNDMTTYKHEIIDNGYDLSLSKYKEDVYEEIKYEKPKLILEKLEKLEEKINDSITELKGVL